MSQAIVGVDDLPDEILLQIFDRSDIPAATLLNVALSSKRLHFICLPLFLAKFEIMNPSEHCDFILRSPQKTPGSLDALTGLKVALFIPSVKHLICKFHMPGDIEDFLYTAMHLRRLNDFILKLSSINTVSLQFSNKRCGCCSELDPGMTLDRDLTEWSDAIGSVLSTILEKGCRTLTVSGGKYMVHSYVPETSRKGRIMSRWRQFLRKVKLAGLPNSYEWIDVLHGDSWIYKRASDTGRTLVLTPITRAAQSRSALRTLIIQSSMFASPPVLHWTISVLRLPTIQNLHLKHLAITRTAWMIFLALIAESCPHLTGLKLSHIRHITASQMLRFLGRLSKLETLSISSSVEWYNNDSPEVGPFPEFRNLTTLTTPAAWLLKLLSSQINAIPNLRSIAIVYNLRNDGLFDWLETPARPNSIPNLLLRSSRHSLLVHLRVTLGRNPGWALLEDYRRYEAQDPPHHLRYVINLTLLIDRKIKPNEMGLSTTLPQWVGLFCELRSLELRSVVLKREELIELGSVVLKRAGLPELKRLLVNGEEVIPGSR
ncbi:hypothetical protein JR316_0000300 [Psilocybe cubensis]|uniref:Uncharacterized protein n=2 Tax=Psilocybe cubensis TaxID=181762 RepID=A0ACB8HFH9_PSICU|nr:hypothetical protein JR316_0000300 [Psilocybe cubensis]KAH9486236.1 hypothetical protein JR316_0000300 [Psilocybe cubensis]